MAAEASWTVGLDMSAFASVEQQVAGFLDGEGVDGRAAFVSQMVIEEIVRNLIEHTPPYAKSEEVMVELSVTPEVVTVSIEDTRPPFDPSEAPDLDVDAPLEERRAGGMGLHLVRSMTDDLSYERVDDRNRLVATVSRS